MLVNTVLQKYITNISTNSGDELTDKFRVYASR